VADEDQDAIPFEGNKDVLSGAEIKKTFVPDRKPESKTHWTSLEVAKIIVGAMTPLLIAGFGWYATDRSHKEESEHTRREDIRIKKTSSAVVISAMVGQESAIADEARKIAGDLHKSTEHSQTLTQLNIFRERTNAYSSQTLINFNTMKPNFTLPTTYRAVVRLWGGKVLDSIRQTPMCADDIGPKGTKITADECVEKNLATANDCMTIVMDALNNFDTLPIYEDPETIKLCEVPENIARPVQFANPLTTRKAPTSSASR
jgi:hypothetical protein